MEEIVNRLILHNERVKNVCKVRLAAYEGVSPCYLSSHCITTLYRILYPAITAQSSPERLSVYRYLKEGNSALPQAIANSLQEKIHLQKVLLRVDKTANESYHLHFSDGTSIHTDILILAIPLPVYKNITFDERVINNHELNRISSIPFGTNAKILVPIEQPKEQTQSCTNNRAILFHQPADTIATLFYVNESGLFNEQSIAKDYAQDEAMVKALYNGDSNYNENIRIDEDRLGIVYNGPVGHSWANDPYAQGSYSSLCAGHEQLFTATQLYDGELVKNLFAPRNNTLFFVGEHTCINYDIMGTMEAAVESGERIARIICNTLNHINHKSHLQKNV